GSRGARAVRDGIRGAPRAGRAPPGPPASPVTAAGRSILSTMRKYFVALALCAAGVGLTAAPPQPPTQSPPAKPPQGDQKKPEGVLTAQQRREVIRRTVDLITQDVSVRNSDGQFVADLAKGDFEVYEDGVKQELVTFVLTHGGKVYNEVTAPPPPLQEGILLP